MVRVDIRELATGTAQVLQDFYTLKHLLYGIGAEQVVVDKVQLVRVSTSIALGPLLCITYRTYATQIHARHQVGGVLLLYQVGEGEVTSVSMTRMTPHDKREGPHTGWPKDVGIRSGLCSTLQRALMYGT